MAPPDKLPPHQQPGQDTWVYPSEEMFFNAMRRKVRGRHGERGGGGEGSTGREGGRGPRGRGRGGAMGDDRGSRVEEA